MTQQTHRTCILTSVRQHIFFSFCWQSKTCVINKADIITQILTKLFSQETFSYSVVSYHMTQADFPTLHAARLLFCVTAIKCFSTLQYMSVWQMKNNSCKTFGSERNWLANIAEVAARFEDRRATGIKQIYAYSTRKTPSFGRNPRKQFTYMFKTLFK